MLKPPLMLYLAVTMIMMMGRFLKGLNLKTSDLKQKLSGCNVHFHRVQGFNKNAIYALKEA